MMSIIFDNDQTPLDRLYCMQMDRLHEEAAAILIQKIIRGRQSRRKPSPVDAQAVAQTGTSKRRRSEEASAEASDEPSTKRSRPDGLSYEPQSPVNTFRPLANPLANPLATPPMKLLFGPEIEFRKLISALGEPHWPASTNVGDRLYDDGTGFVIVDRFNVAKLQIESEGLALEKTAHCAIYTIVNQ